VHPQKVLDRPVIGPLEFLIEKTGRQFTISPVIMKAFAASILSRTWFVGAIAVFSIRLHNTFHILTSQKLF
jgi:hypothetical protein